MTCEGSRDGSHCDDRPCQPNTSTDFGGVAKRGAAATHTEVSIFHAAERLKPRRGGTALIDATSARLQLELRALDTRDRTRTDYRTKYGL